MWTFPRRTRQYAFRKSRAENRIISSIAENPAFMMWCPQHACTLGKAHVVATTAPLTDVIAHAVRLVTSGQSSRLSLLHAHSSASIAVLCLQIPSNGSCVQVAAMAASNGECRPHQNMQITNATQRQLQSRALYAKNPALALPP